MQQIFKIVLKNRYKTQLIFLSLKKVEFNAVAYQLIAWGNISVGYVYQT